MKTTEHLKLKKPDLTDYVNIGDLNDNMDILDGSVNQLNQTSTGQKESMDNHTSDTNNNAHKITNITGLQSALNGKEPTLHANQKRPIYVSKEPPTNPQEGDIWIEVE